MYELTKLYITGHNMGRRITSIVTEKVMPGTITVGSYGLDVYEVLACKAMSDHAVKQLSGA